jgi:2-amino-4-hydroxy-6-hydroxymethyldihydropteridine diphosphokinase
MKTVLSIGSNLGDRLNNLKQVRDRICSLPNIKLLSQSSVYESDPVEVIDEYGNMLFLNAILIVDCDNNPEKLLKCFKNIEKEMGRTKSGELNEPRPADIDIIFMEKNQVNTPTLTIPHPRWSERLFVVRPLAELLPDFTAPGESRTIREVLLSLPKSPKVLPLQETW